MNAGLSQGKDEQLLQILHAVTHKVGDTCPGEQVALEDSLPWPGLGLRLGKSVQPGGTLGVGWRSRVHLPVGGKSGLQLLQDQGLHHVVRLCHQVRGRRLG